MTVYLQPEEFADPPAPFRQGRAGHVWLDASGEFRRDTRVRLSANTTHALLGHGVVDRLNRLELMGVLGSGRDVVVPQSLLGDVSRVLIEADRKTYGGSWEFGVASDEPDADYRVRIDNREYQRGLARLNFLMSSASRVGFGAWLRI